jgi:hypothetical protein
LCRSAFVSALAAGLGTLACAPLPPAVVEIGAATPGAAPPAEGEPGADGPAAKGAGCSWGTGMVSAHGEDLPLCFAVDQACFARVAAPVLGAVELFAGDPASSGARASLQVDGVELRGWTFPAELSFSPQIPVVLGGVAIPWDGSRLQVERVERRALDLSLQPGDRLELLRGNWRARVPCSAVKLSEERPSMEAVRSAVKRPGQGDLGERVLTPGQVIRIAADASGPDVAAVKVSDDFTTVEVLQQLGHRSFVLWWDADMVYFGWVDTAVLSVAPPKPRAAGSASPTSLAGTAPLPGTRCLADTPLYAKVFSAQEEVGTIGKGTRFDIIERRDDFTQVHLRTTRITTEPSSSWLVKTSALAGCKLE